MGQILYKYRGIENFRFFVDIILNNRLYAARYSELNDPMEGQYNGDVSDKIAEILSTNKGSCRICSLSKTRDCELLWSHYSEGHRGVAIGVEVGIGSRIEDIEYSGLKFVNASDVPDDEHEKILLHKLEYWSYEQEKRVLTYSPFINVEVKEVITGRWMSKDNVKFISSLVERINPSISIISAQSFMPLVR